MRVTHANPLSGLQLEEAATLGQNKGDKAQFRTQNDHYCVLGRKDICKTKWSSVEVTKKQFAKLIPKPEALNFKTTAYEPQENILLG